MTIGVSDSYRIRISYGDYTLIVDPRGIQELTITCDMNRFLPSVRMKVSDASGELTHLTPLDAIRTISFDISAGRTGFNFFNTYDFHVYRRFPSIDNIFDMEGLLAVNSLFTPSFVRGFNQQISTTLEAIATELGVDETDISFALNYVQPLVQADWTNSQFLSYLKNNVIGEHNEPAFYCFVKVLKAKKYFVFKSLSEFILSPVTHRFIIGSDNTRFSDPAQPSYYPVFNWRAVDNYKANGVLGIKTRAHTYFDYDESKLKGSSVNLDNFNSLTEMFAISNDDPDESISLQNGVSNDFTNNFQGVVAGEHWKRTVDASKMWIDTIGLPTICPGDTADVKFTTPYSTKYQNSLTYQGFWLVEKVIHSFGMGYMSKVFLTRNGYNVGDLETKLVKSSISKRKRT